MIIHFSTSFRLLDEYVSEYNSHQESLSDCVRQATVATAQDIIKVYAAYLNKVPNVDALLPNNLPSLRTNNAQLAKLGKTSKRTVQRHLARLLQSGVLTNKVWHGSKASYELWINPDILGIARGIEEVLAELEARNKIAQSSIRLVEGRFERIGVSSWPHTDTGNLNNKIIIEVDRCKSALSEDANLLEKRSSLSLTGDNGASSESGNLTGYPGEKLTGPLNGSGPGGNVSHQGPGEKLGRQLVHRSGGNDPEEKGQAALLSFYIDALWRHAERVLYQGVYLTEYQLKSAKQLLWLWYEPISQGNVARIHQQYVDRVKMVAQYVAKDPKNRFVLLPDQFFDPHNPKGLAGTKAWYERKRKRKAEVRAKLIAHNQIRRFKQNLVKPLAERKPVMELYRECEAKVKALNRPELLEKFLKSVGGHNIR